MSRKIALAVFAIFAINTDALAQQNSEKYGPYYVDTGSHTCTKQGQEHKVERDFRLSSDRTFIPGTVSYVEISKFGAGSCGIASEVKEKRKVRTEHGYEVETDFLVGYSVYAIADCTSNLGNIGKRVGTECAFSAETQEIK